MALTAFRYMCGSSPCVSLIFFTSTRTMLSRKKKLTYKDMMLCVRKPPLKDSHFPQFLISCVGSRCHLRGPKKLGKRSYNLISIAGTLSISTTKTLSDLNEQVFPQMTKYFPRHVKILSSTVMRVFILYFDFYFYKGETFWILLSFRSCFLVFSL